MIPNEFNQLSVFIIHPEINTFEINGRSSKFKLDEVSTLVLSINLKLVFSKIIKLKKPKSSTFLTKGIINDLKGSVKLNDLDILMINHSISPVQQRNLEKELKLKVIDRTHLILEIFGERAKSHEGRLQVELAHLIYQRSRLVKTWTHLERQRGGFGFLGGPGESQLEIDRRLIDKRIKYIRSSLINVRRTRSIQRNKRNNNEINTVSLIGYTNAGKSTLFNNLVDANVLSKNILFSTLDPTIRELKLPSGKAVVISDTVGFISNLPTELIESFKSTLEEISLADLIIHVRDITSNSSKEDANDVYSILQDLGVNKHECSEKIIEVFNKADLFKGDKIVENSFKKNCCLISAKTGKGISELLNEIEKRLNKNDVIKTLDVPFGNGKLINWLYEHSSILNNKTKPNKNIIKVRISRSNINRFKSKWPLFNF